MERVRPALAVLLLLAGCSEPLNRGGTINGKVTIDRAPVTAGNVLMVSEDGKWTGYAPLRGDGTYTVKEPPLGNVKIAIQTELYRGRSLPTKGGGMSGSTKPGSAGMVMPDPSVRGLVYKATPAKYEQVETSGLTGTVVRGDQELDLPLTSH